MNIVSQKKYKGKGVRTLHIHDQLPNCEIVINKQLYILDELVKGKKVVDIGCGFGHNKKLVNSLGGEWVGVEPFEGGEHTVVASAENLPFDNGSFDVAIMDAVLEHIPDVAKAFEEVARVLKPNGIFIGYVAFMECFHEISYSHLSFKALEYYADKNGMRLEKIAGGKRFGIDYHLRILFYPFPFNTIRAIISSLIRNTFRIKSIIGYTGLRLKRKLTHKQAKELASLYYQLECLRQSNGFQYIIRKSNP